jgi:predicted nuclease of restriction endonuclease-like (RecB) superfamily
MVQSPDLSHEWCHRGIAMSKKRSRTADLLPADGPPDTTRLLEDLRVLIEDFLGLHDTFSEEDLERAILRELEAFLLELGEDFCFVARQKRVTVDREDYHLDLLFFHRRLRRLVAVELKLGKFQAADKGQMELYLRWLDRHDRRPGEGTPLGLILCAEKSAEHVELLQLEASGIRVAEYLTELPPRPVLEQKLHDAIAFARRRLGADFADQAPEEADPGRRGRPGAGRTIPQGKGAKAR